MAKARTDQIPTKTKTGQNLPAAVKDKMDLLMLNAKSTRQQLDILRKTRGQRDVGSVKVPPHLRAPEPLTTGYRDSSGKVVDVVKRANVAAVLPAED